MLEAETTEDLSFNFDFKTILIHNILKVSRQKQQKLPDCLSRENGFGKPGLHRSNFGGISGRKDACDFPKPFHILWQNSKFVNIIFLPFDMEFFLAMLISNIPMQKKINIPRVFKWQRHFHVK